MHQRHELPQIPKEKFKDFIKFLKDEGVETSVVLVNTGELKPIQSHVNREKVDKFKTDPSIKKIPLIISQGGFILDGHHRWIAFKENSPDGQCAVILVNCKIDELIDLGHAFEGSFVKSVYEVTNYVHMLEDCDEEDHTLMVRKSLRFEGSIK